MNVVKIRLRKPRRVFSFLCTELPLKRDEACIVLSDRGEEFGTCILPPEPCPEEMIKRFSMKVVRKVTEKDERSRSFIEEEERRALDICLKKIKERKLPMKLVDVEVTFDKRKVIFYFTADDRVDFRELVRDLAHDLRARIEMRHIQVRDEAKMVGGLGGCGRELCCSSWMNEFRPISMRMAKAQNLSLNPSKISGQCGRLLCCLSYENDRYEEMRKKAREEIKARQEKAGANLEGEGAKEKSVAPERTERPGRRRDAKGGTADARPRTESRPSAEHSRTEARPKGEVAPSRGARNRGRGSEQASNRGEEQSNDSPQKTESAVESPVSPAVTAADGSPTPEKSAEGAEKKTGRRRRKRKRKRGPGKGTSGGTKD
ncbi:MAG: stage 0 sporulation family protein [Candidatus Hydrogenedentes bacterium]|nr:stage 0 sporulation family protein [Candidatus Hydrogenedentota bacterium]